MAIGAPPALAVSGRVKKKWATDDRGEPGGE
jgi:hypothetical protein